MADITFVSPEATKTGDRVERGWIAATPAEKPWPDHPLPAKSLAKLQRAKFELEAARTAYFSAQDRMRDADRREAIVRHAQATPRNAGGVTPQGRVELDRLAVERNFTRDAIERAEARMREFAFVHAVERWIADALHLSTLARHIDLPSVRSKDFRRDVAAARAEIAALADEWEAVETAPVPAHQLRTDAVAEIERVAASGALSINRTSRDGAPMGLSKRLAIWKVGDTIAGDAGAGLFCWLMRDQLVARVDDIVRGLDLTGAMTDRERAQEFERIAREKLAAERREEALIVAAEADGLHIPRRADIDPRAFLEIDA